MLPKHPHRAELGRGQTAGSQCGSPQWGAAAQPLAPSLWPPRVHIDRKSGLDGTPSSFTFSLRHITVLRIGLTVGLLAISCFIKIIITFPIIGGLKQYYKRLCFYY